MVHTKDRLSASRMVAGRALVAGIALMGALGRPAASPMLHLYGSSWNVRDMAVDGERLWLATSAGLVLYRDGVEPVVYSAVGDMKDIRLTAVAVEGPDRLWLGSMAGYVIEFNPGTERFTAYNSLAYAGWDIACMRLFGPYLLVGSEKGLSVFSRSSKRALWNATRFGALAESSVRGIETAGDTIALVLPGGVAWLKAPDLRTVNLNDPAVWTVIAASNPGGVVIDSAGVRPHPRRIRTQAATTFEFTDVVLKQAMGSDSVPRDTISDLLRNGQTIFSAGTYVNCAAEFGGNVYAGTRDRHLYRLRPSGAPPEQVRFDGPPVPDVRQAAVDRQGTLWFVMDNISYGVGRFAGEKWSVITEETDSTPGFGPTAVGRPEAMNRVLVSNTDDVWVGTHSHGAKWFRRRSGDWRNYIDTGFAVACPSWGIPTCASYTYFPSPLVRFDAALAAWWTFVGSFCEDSTGKIWIGQERAYNRAVIHVFDPASGQGERQWRTLARDDYGFPGIYTRALAAARHPSRDTQYVYAGFHEEESGGHFGFSVIRFTDAMNGALSVTHAYPTSSVHDIAVVDPSVVWVATSAGLHRMRNSDVATFRQILRVRPDGPLHAITTSPAGNPVFAMNGDLWEYRDSVDRRDSLINLTASGLLGPDVYDICSEPSAGRYWISTSRGLFRFSTGEYTQPPVTGYSSAVVYPNPLSRSRRAAEVIFDRLVQGSTVVVYDVAGTMVWRSGPNDVHGSTSQMIRWNGRNTGGALVRLGTYYYHIHADDSKGLVGKLLVIP